SRHLSPGAVFRASFFGDAVGAINFKHLRTRVGWPGSLQIPVGEGRDTIRGPYVWATRCPRLVTATRARLIGSTGSIERIDESGAIRASQVEDCSGHPTARAMPSNVAPTTTPMRMPASCGEKYSRTTIAYIGTTPPWKRREGKCGTERPHRSRE